MSDFGLGDSIVMEPVRLAALRHHGLIRRGERPVPIPTRFKRWRDWSQLHQKKLTEGAAKS